MAFCTLVITVAGIILTAIFKLINRTFNLALERYHKRVAVTRSAFALDLVERKTQRLIQSRRLSMEQFVKDEESLLWEESLSSARKTINQNDQLISQIQNTSQKEVVKAFNQAFLLKLQTMKPP